MDKKIVFVGKSCSGKSTIAQELAKFGFKAQVSTTSRPKRDYEIDGKDYHFVSKEEAEEMINANQFIEIDNFNGWYYGLTYEDFNASDILVITPRGLKQYLDKFPRENFIVIYIETSVSMRMERINSRNDTHDSFHRRWVSDEIDFENWEQWGMPWDMKISLQTENVLPNLINILTNKNK
jgi:guanylate kinase